MSNAIQLFSPARRYFTKKPLNNKEALACTLRRPVHLPRYDGRIHVTVVGDTGVEPVTSCVSCKALTNCANRPNIRNLAAHSCS